MRFIESYENDFRLFLYGKKAKQLKVSEFMLTGRSGVNDIKIGKLISTSKDNEELRNNVCNELLKETNTDYLHFSLIMGLYFGCFNLYNYLYIKPSVRKKIVESNPNRKDTMNFIILHYSSILEYFHDKYGIDDYTLKSIISRMLFCIDNEDIYTSLYNNYVTREIGLILMGVSLSDKFTSCSDAINSFYEKNEDCKLKTN